MSAPITFAPACANSMAISRPMPAAAPVIKAVLPSNPNNLATMLSLIMGFSSSVLAALIESTADECGRDVGFLHVSRPTGNSPSETVAHALLHGVFSGVTIAAHDLHAVDSHVAYHFVRKALGNARFDDRRQPLRRVGGSSIDEQSRRLYSHGHVGNFELHRLKVDYGFAELATLLRIRDSVL